MGGTPITGTPTLFVCHGDDNGPRIHPCRRVQEALRAAGIEYDKVRSEEHTSELQSPVHLVCRLLLEKKKKMTFSIVTRRRRGDPAGVIVLDGADIVTPAAACG